MNSLIVFIYFTNNNVIFSIANIKGQVLNWFSIGKKQIKGRKKLSFLTCHLVTISVINYVMHLNCSTIHLRIRGFNKSKRRILKLFKKSALGIITISDFTKQPHNGCKLRRIRSL